MERPEKKRQLTFRALAFRQSNDQSFDKGLPFETSAIVSSNLTASHYPDQPSSGKPVFYHTRVHL